MAGNTDSVCVRFPKLFELKYFLEVNISIIDQHILTVHSESIQTHFTFFNFVMLRPDTTFVREKYNFRNVCKFCIFF